MGQKLSLADHPDLTERTYQILKEAILSGKRPPGSRLVIVEIASELGVSRTPVADALSRLLGEGFVAGSPRRGYAVTNLDARDIAELMDASRILQQGAAELGARAVDPARVQAMRRLLAEMEQLVDKEGHYTDFPSFTRLDRELHLLLVGSSLNSRLTQLYDQLNSHSHVVRVRLASDLSSHRPPYVLKEHRAIVEAFAAGDVAAARDAIGQHLDATKMALVEAWQKQSRVSAEMAASLSADQ